MTSFPPDSSARVAFHISVSEKSQGNCSERHDQRERGSLHAYEYKAERNRREREMKREEAHAEILDKKEQREGRTRKSENKTARQNTV